MKSSYNSVKDWRVNTKLRLIECFGGSCGICGYSECAAALEFHHLVPEEKDFSFSSMCVSWSKLSTEMEKCVMLCANCHREVHAGIKNIPVDIRRFLNVEVPSLMDKCPICGEYKPISKITCSRQCAGIHRGKINWDDYDVVKLYQDIGSYLGVARYIGDISDNAVKKRLKKVLNK